MAGRPLDPPPPYGGAAPARWIGDHGPALTPAEAAALHDRPERVAWFVLPAPSGNGVIARAHMEGRRGKYFDVRWPLVKDAELRSALCTGSRDQGLIAVDA